MNRRENDSNISYFAIAPGENAKFWVECKKGGFIAVGWREIGDLKGLSKDKIKEKLRSIYSKRRADSAQLQNIIHFVDMKLGDKVIANKGKSKIVGVGEVIGKYYYDEKEKRFAQKVPVKWYDMEEKIIPIQKDWIYTIKIIDMDKFEYLVNYEKDSDVEKYPNGKKDMILKKWKEIANKYSKSIHFTFGKEYEERIKSLRKLVNEFLNNPTEDNFKAFWKKEYIYAVQMGSRAEKILEKWDKKGGNIKGLSKLIKDINESEEYKEEWEEELGAKHSLGEFFGNLKIEKYPIRTECVNFGMKKFGYNPRSGYKRFIDPFNNFKDEYLSKVGHATAGTNHEVPINYEIDQLFNVIHKLKQKDIEKEENEEISKFFRLIIGDSNGPYVNYFWVSANPSEYTISQLKNTKEEFYPAYNKTRTKRRIFEAFLKIKPNDKIIFYESSPTQKVLGIGECVKELHKEYDKDHGKEVEGVTLRYIRDIEGDGIEWYKLKENEGLKDCYATKSNAQGTLIPIKKEEYDTILLLEQSTRDIYNKEDFRITNLHERLEIKSLYFESSEKIVNKISTALKEGKNLILIGPPGSGKSKLAKEICEFYCRENGYVMTTATSDWSTHDTTGGYKISRENELVFEPGIFLRCFQTQEDKLINKWLIIDEINRADIDKAFGALFSALTGDDITLPFIKNDNQIKIIGKPKDGEKIEPNKYYVHDDWRIIATMNTFDKASLYEMSYAFMRRFAFIPIDIPTVINDKLIKEYINKWNLDIEDEIVTSIGKLWEIINKYRKIGPAIIEDIYKYVLNSGPKDYTSPLIMYVMPQFEGKEEKDFKDFLEDVSKLDYINKEEVIKFIISYFEILEEKLK